MPIDGITWCDKVQRQRLEWLGQLAQMSDGRNTKSILFGWLSQKRPCCDPWKEQRNVVENNLMELGFRENGWYEEATISKARWRELCVLGLENWVKDKTQAHVRSSIVKKLECSTCTNKFSWESDMKRHN